MKTFRDLKEYSVLMLSSLVIRVSRDNAITIELRTGPGGLRGELFIPGGVGLISSEEQKTI